MIKFDGRVAIVTGAGNGLGRAYAIQLAARGARVVVNNRRRALDAPGDSSADRTVAAIRDAGGEAIANWDDVRTPASGAALVSQALAMWGRLDIVINNAGVSQHQAFHNISLEEFREIFDLNFYGSMCLTHAAYAHMRRQSYGRIVASASAAGLHGLHGLTAYAASKAALIGLMRSLAQEGAPRGVYCNTICPYASTQMTAAHASPEFAAAMPPDLVAPMVLYLASEQTRLNGRVIVAGKGAFRRAVMIEGAGLGYERAADVTPESIAHDIERIDSIESAQEYADALASYEHFFKAYRGVA